MKTRDCVYEKRHKKILIHNTLEEFIRSRVLPLSFQEAKTKTTRAELFITQPAADHFCMLSKQELFIGSR